MKRDSIARAVLSAVGGLTVLGSLLACADQGPPQVPASLRAQLIQAASLPPELDVAQQYAEYECLKEAGYDIPLSLRIPPPSLSDNVAGVVGLFPSIQVAEEFGYPYAIDVSSDDLVTAWIDSLPESRQIQLEFARWGDVEDVATYYLPNGGSVSAPRGGCFGEAVTRLYGSIENYLQISAARTVLSGASSAPATEPPGAEAYRNCMADGGYQTSGLAETTREAMELFGSSRPPGSKPTAAEAAMAVTDARCQFEAELLAYFTDRFVENAAEWISANEGWVVGTATIVNDAMSASREIMSGQ